VREEYERPVSGEGYHHVVANQTRGSASGSSLLAEHVRHQREL
jgi:hypothetical protein